MQRLRLGRLGRREPILHVQRLCERKEGRREQWREGQSYVTLGVVNNSLQQISSRPIWEMGLGDISHMYVLRYGVCCLLFGRRSKEIAAKG